PSRRRRRASVQEESEVFAEPVAPPPRARSDVDTTQWRMRGTVFDIISGEPIANADVVFQEPSTGRRFATSTDAQGRYRAQLPVSSEGFDLQIRAPDYEPKYFEDSSPSYRKLSPEERQHAADDLLRILQNRGLIQQPGGSVLNRDYVLIPLTR
ncbi:MAG: carboxypeptidase regulatory-like domain-containing protein, partial [Elusimicrobia bacterium]|nr:carboxypeptidase regulatory-like domain-containing protein [Elusimicrobiota bacterium]